MSLTVNLVSNDNGVGLSTDMDLMEGMLGDAGVNVRRVNWTLDVMPRCDVAIYLELLNPRLLQFSRHSIGILNPEVFLPQWRLFLFRLILWAKGRHTQQALQSLGRPSTLMGFLSRDLYDPTVARTKTCLHIRDKSIHKGTETVLETWRRYPDLPPLTVISDGRIAVPPGVTLLPRLPYDKFVREVNAAMIHVCPSRVEGWGHVIAEGLSVGATVVTTDASPMNEHVRPAWGFLVPAHFGRTRGYPGQVSLVDQWDVDPDDLAEAVWQAYTLSDPRREEMSTAARAHVAQRNDQFRQAALTALGELGDG